MLKYGEEYVEQELDYYAKMYQEKIIRGLNNKAKDLGYILVKTIEPQAVVV